MPQFVNRWLARYLKRRGWVVFWLDDCARRCWVSDGTESGDQRLARAPHDSCWLALYESERKAGR